jgi:hypothetical protein
MHDGQQRRDDDEQLDADVAAGLQRVRQARNDTLVVGMDDDGYGAAPASVLQTRADALLRAAGAMTKTSECDQHRDGDQCSCGMRGQDGGLALIGAVQQRRGGRIVERSWSEVIPAAVAQRITWRAAWRHDSLLDTLMGAGMSRRRARAVIEAMGAGDPPRQTDREIVAWSASTAATMTTADPTTDRRVPTVIATRPDGTQILGTAFTAWAPDQPQPVVTRHVLPATATLPAVAVWRVSTRTPVARRTVRTVVAADGRVRWSTPASRRRKQSASGVRVSQPRRPAICCDSVESINAVLRNLVPGDTIRISVGTARVSVRRLDQPVVRLAVGTARTRRAIATAADWIIAHT